MIIVVILNAFAAGLFPSYCTNIIVDGYICACYDININRL